MKGYTPRRKKHKNMILDKQLPMCLRAAILFAQYCWSRLFSNG